MAVIARIVRRDGPVRVLILLACGLFPTPPGSQVGVTNGK